MCTPCTHTHTHVTVLNVRAGPTGDAASRPLLLPRVTANATEDQLDPHIRPSSLLPDSTGRSGSLIQLIGCLSTTQTNHVGTRERPCDDWRTGPQYNNWSGAAILMHGRTDPTTVTCSSKILQSCSPCALPRGPRHTKTALCAVDRTAARRTCFVDVACTKQFELRLARAGPRSSWCRS